MRARLFAPENRKWWTLVAVAVGLFMIMLDNTVVNVALPSIRRDLGIGISELEWVVNGYALTFGVLLLTGGKLADMLVLDANPVADIKNTNTVRYVMKNGRLYGGNTLAEAHARASVIEEKV